MNKENLDIGRHDSTRNRADKRKNKWGIIIALIVSPILIFSTMNVAAAHLTYAPKNVTNLTNNSYANDYINWTWTDPNTTRSFNVSIYINGQYVTNVSKGIRHYNATNLTPNSKYTVSTRIVNRRGVSSIWANDTEWTSPIIVAPIVVTPTPTPTATPTPTTTPKPTATPTPTPTPPPSTPTPTPSTPTPTVPTSAGPISNPGHMSQLNWAGYTWNVHSSQEDWGGNHFSDSSNNVWVDTQNRLHLKITNVNGMWYSAEIETANTIGYGTYATTVYSNPNTLAPNVIAGMFYYKDPSDEMDMEFSRWGNPRQIYDTFYTVYDGSSTSAKHSQGYLTNTASTTHAMTWNENSISMVSKDSSNIIGSWTYPGTYSPATGGRFHLNFWVENAAPPADGKEQELVLSSFSMK